MRADPLLAPARRARLFVARRPLVYWLLVGLLAATTAGVVRDRIAGADAARRRWGTDQVLLVATRDLGPGEAVGAADTRRERWPVALAPPDAVTSLDGMVAVTSAAIGQGEPLVRRRLGRGGAGPVAAVLPLGTRGVSVPLGDAPLPVRAGDRVDVVSAGLGGVGAVVARDAVVISRDGSSAVIAVAAADVAAVAEALTGGAVVLAVNGDPPGQRTA